MSGNGSKKPLPFQQIKQKKSSLIPWKKVSELFDQRVLPQIRHDTIDFDSIRSWFQSITNLTANDVVRVEDTIRKIVDNIVNHPNQTKFRSINLSKLRGKIGTKRAWLLSVLLLQMHFDVVWLYKSNKKIVYLQLQYTDSDANNNFKTMRQEMNYISIMMKKYRCSIVLNLNKIDILIDQIKHYNELRSVKDSASLQDWVVDEFGFENYSSVDFFPQYAYRLYKLLTNYIMNPIYLNRNDLIYYQVMVPLKIHAYGLEISSKLNLSENGMIGGSTTWKCACCGTLSSIMTDVYCKNQRCGNPTGINPLYVAIVCKDFDSLNRFPAPPKRYLDDEEDQEPPKAVKKSALDAARANTIKWKYLDKTQGPVLDVNKKSVSKNTLSIHYAVNAGSAMICTSEYVTVADHLYQFNLEMAMFHAFHNECGRFRAQGNGQQSVQKGLTFADGRSLSRRSSAISTFIGSDCQLNYAAVEWEPWTNVLKPQLELSSPSSGSRVVPASQNADLEFDNFKNYENKNVATRKRTNGKNVLWTYPKHDVHPDEYELKYLLSPDLAVVSLINEVIRNGCEKDLLPRSDKMMHATGYPLDTDISRLERQYGIFDLLYEKMIHPRSKRIGNYMFQYCPAMLLALILYTSSKEANYSMARAHGNGDEKSWKLFAEFLSFAIDIASNFELDPNAMVYTGLNNGIIDTNELVGQETIFFPSFQSFSFDNDIAKEWRGDRGCIIGERIKNITGCDVSWLSPFEKEQEVLVSKHTCVLQLSDESMVITTHGGNCQWIFDEENFQAVKEVFDLK